MFVVYENNGLLVWDTEDNTVEAASKDEVNRVKSLGYQVDFRRDTCPIIDLYNTARNYNSDYLDRGSDVYGYIGKLTNKFVLDFDIYCQYFDNMSVLVLHKGVLDKVMIVYVKQYNRGSKFVFKHEMHDLSSELSLFSSLRVQYTGKEVRVTFKDCNNKIVTKSMGVH